jgi:hypothetical protein
MELQRIFAAIVLIAALGVCIYSVVLLIKRRHKITFFLCLFSIYFLFIGQISKNDAITLLDHLNTDYYTTTLLLGYFFIVKYSFQIILVLLALLLVNSYLKKAKIANEEI